MTSHRFLKLSALFLFTAVSTLASAQQVKVPGGTIFHLTSPHTSFPDTGRVSGHLYDSVLYDGATHYRDSSVLILVPDKLKKGQTLDIIFWFHGWRNNIDTALQYYHLQQQFLASDREAVLVMAETAKNSPDSYGGKLEQPGAFTGLVKDVMVELKKKKVIGENAKPANIVLAGHSGAFRVIAKILQNGGMPVQEVVLFDALYSQTDLFDAWIKKDPKNRFINWYTNEGGGTDEESIKFMGQLKNEGLTYTLAEEKDLTPAILKANRILFVHAPRPHNDIIFNPDNFLLVLENSPYLSPLH